MRNIRLKKTRAQIQIQIQILTMMKVLILVTYPKKVAVRERMTIVMQTKDVEVMT
jgi:hypothetical protein